MKKSDFLLTFCSVLLFCLGAWAVVFVFVSIGPAFSFVWFHKSIGAFALMSLLSCTLIWSKKYSWALVPLALLLVMNVVRWIANWNYVFPFGERFLGKPQPSLFLEFWQSQQFLSALIVVITAFLALYAAKHRR